MKHVVANLIDTVWVVALVLIIVGLVWFFSMVVETGKEKSTVPCKCTCVEQCKKDNLDLPKSPQ